MTEPFRGELWSANLDPIRGHEQSGIRPVLVVSVDPFNQSFLGLIMIIPLTSKRKGFPTHIEVLPGQTGLKSHSFAMCEHLRSISKERLIRKIGRVDSSIMRQVDDRLKIILSPLEEGY